MGLSCLCGSTVCEYVVVVGGFLMEGLVEILETLETEGGKEPVAVVQR